MNTVQLYRALAKLLIILQKLKIQKRFLLALRYKLRKINNPTKTLAKKLNLQFLDNWRCNSDTIFQYECLTNLIDFSELLAKMSLYILSNTLILFIFDLRDNILVLINIILLNGNILNKFDNFFDSPSKFREILKKRIIMINNL